MLTRLVVKILATAYYIVVDRAILLKHAFIRILGVLRSELSENRALRHDDLLDVDDIDFRSRFGYLLDPSLHHDFGCIAFLTT